MTEQEFIGWDTDDGVVRFPDSSQDYLIVKGRGDRDGAIATREQYDSFALNYAHAYSDGPVMRFHATIGDIKDLIVSREGE
jgi:hypothetical protein